MNTKRIGNIAEAKVLARFVELGYQVCIPFGDNEPYDLVIDRGNGFERVQVKTGRHSPDQTGVTFNTCSLDRREGSKSARIHYLGRVELFAVYFPPLDSLYLIPTEEAPARSATTFRFKGSKTRNNIKIIDDYIM